MCNDHSTIRRTAVRRDSTAPVWYTILKVSENEEELSNLKYCAILEEGDSNNYILSEPEANNDDDSRQETTQTSRAGVKVGPSRTQAAPRPRRVPPQYFFALRRQCRL